MEEAAAAGIVEVHLSGGEPLLRPDLREIAARARALELYVNLVTSGWGLDSRGAAQLASSGVEHVQLSFQAADPVQADHIAGTKAHSKKLTAAAAVKAAGMALTFNAVLHRDNIDDVTALIGLAEEVSADRIELAQVQWYGWALQNRAALAPCPDQVIAATAAVQSAAERLAGRIDVTYVAADLIEGRPKPCTGGWGRRQMTVAPDGVVLPCGAARQLPGIQFERVGERALSWIWYESPSFNRFRGTSWMSEPCRSCDRREADFGGCRCQAFQLAGDAAVTDPVCPLSPHHRLARAVYDSDVAAGRREPAAVTIHRGRGSRSAQISAAPDDHKRRSSR